MTETNVELEFDGAVAVLKLNRPDVLNSMTPSLARDARAAIAQVNETPSARALLITGAGRAFCAGAELKDEFLNGSASQSASEQLDVTMRDDFNPWITDLDQMRIPVIAAVNGVAAGAGVGLALAADITVAASSASFILSFCPKLGLIPDVGTTWYLPRRIGLARATALSLLGDRLDAQEAAQWGLIAQSVDDAQLLNTAMGMARTLARLPSGIALELRRALKHSQSNSLDAQLDYERERQCTLIESAAFREGVIAFRAKRTPVFV